MHFDAKRKLIRHGLILFFLGLVIGFVVPAFANPRAGLAAHLEGVMNGTFLIALGLAWSELHLSRKLSAAAFYLAVYGAYANIIGTTLAAALGTSEATPIAGAGHHSDALRENLVLAVLVSVGISMLAAVGIALWGAMRTKPADAVP